MNKIDIYISTEFERLQNDLDLHLKGPFDINQKKEFLTTYIPNEILFLSKNLTGALINLMMSNSKKHIKKFDVSIQNKFFEADFRTQIKDLTSELKHQLKLEPQVVSFTRDPRIVNGLIAGGTTFIISSAVTTGLLISSNLVSSIVAGIATLILTVLAYKTSYNKSTEQARLKLQRDINKFLITAEQQVKEWLYSINELFEAEFNLFCIKHQLD